MLPLPRRFFIDSASGIGVDVAGTSAIGVALTFASNEPGQNGDRERRTARRILEEACHSEALEVLGWREVPVDMGALGDSARASAPRIEQAILVHPAGVGAEDAPVASVSTSPRCPFRR